MPAQRPDALPSVDTARIFIVDTYTATGGNWHMRVQVQKWGNSLALRIPRSVAEDVGVRAGTVLDVVVSRGRVVATPVPPTVTKLKDLLRRVTRRNIHREIDWGVPVGRESW